MESVDTYPKYLHSNLQSMVNLLAVWWLLEKPVQMKIVAADVSAKCRGGRSQRNVATIQGVVHRAYTVQ